jgi:diguanylate cyclase (GGDEF)-like protein/PAS domain S-box-containing protein
LTACSPTHNSQKPIPKANDGVIDLRDWDFEVDGSINLSGEWAFFWDELLQPDDITSLDQAIHVPVPDVWTDYEIDGGVLPPGGFATYHLTLYPPEGNQTLGLYNEGQGSAYIMWVNGQIIAQNGQIGTQKQGMVPEKKPLAVFFESDGDKVDIVLQISNFHHRKAGFRNSLLLGQADTIHQFQLQNWFVEAFSVGTLFVMGLYHFFLYVYRTRNMATIWFAVLCWATTLRIGVTNQSTLLFHMPFIDWHAAFRIEYLVFFLIPIPFALFLQTIFPKDVPRWFVRAVIGFGLSFTVFLVFSDTMALSYTSTYYQAVFLLNIIFYFYLLVQLIRKRRDGAIHISLAFIIISTAIIIETLILQNVIDAIIITSFLPMGQITSFSFLAFIFAQAVLLANLFSKSFQRVETLSGELEETNINLEISERKYRTIFEDSKDMIFIAGLDGKIEDVSPACEELLGYRKSELMLMTLFDVIVDPEDSDRFQKTIIDQGSVMNFESELRRKDGDVISTLVSATPRLDKYRKVNGVQGSVRDITDRKRAEAERMRALELEQIAITDPLTKVYNRRYFFEAADKEIERSIRSGSPISVILFDVDHFKNVNDDHGHLAGDQVLINIANVCQQNIRSMDLFARYGGEEFIILMPDTDSISALDSAERLRQIVKDMPVTIGDDMDISVTISMGIACRNNISQMDINDLLDRADQALYESKEAGRNRVTLWDKISTKNPGR